MLYSFSIECIFSIHMAYYIFFSRQPCMIRNTNPKYLFSITNLTSLISSSYTMQNLLFDGWWWLLWVCYCCWIKFTTHKQDRPSTRHSDSDSDLCLNDTDDYCNGSGSVSGSTINNNIGTVDSRVRRSSNGRVSIRLVSDERSTILATYKNIDH